MSGKFGTGGREWILGNKDSATLEQTTYECFREFPL
jgi:hypothetical protein